MICSLSRVSFWEFKSQAFIATDISRVLFLVAYPVETVRFEWFTRRKDAIDKNPDVKLPELYIDRYETTTCPNERKSGAFSCLRAVFRLKRDVGFHIAQTYIPTSLALMFSWVSRSAILLNFFI